MKLFIRLAFLCAALLGAQSVHAQYYYGRLNMDTPTQVKVITGIYGPAIDNLVSISVIRAITVTGDTVTLLGDNLDSGITLGVDNLGAEEVNWKYKGAKMDDGTIAVYLEVKSGVTLLGSSLPNKTTRVVLDPVQFRKTFKTAQQLLEDSGFDLYRTQFNNPYGTPYNYSTASFYYQTVTYTPYDPFAGVFIGVISEAPPPAAPPPVTVHFP